MKNVVIVTDEITYRWPDVIDARNIDGVAIFEREHSIFSIPLARIVSIEVFK